MNNEEFDRHASKKLGKRKSSSKGNIKDTKGEDPNHVKQFKNEKVGKKGIGKKLKKFSTAPSISVTSTDTNNYFVKSVHQFPHSQRLEEMLTRETQPMKISDDLLGKLPWPKELEEYMTRDPSFKGPMSQTTWMSLERNIVFFGFGAKQSLIDGLVNNYLKGEDVLAIDGNNGILAVRSLLSTITKLIGVEDRSALGIILNATYLAERLDRYYGTPVRNFIVNESTQKLRREGTTIRRDGIYEHNVSRLYIIIHDIGALQLREAQWSLSILASCSSVCLISTLEHLNTSLLWDSEMLVRFNWVYRHVPTFQHHQINPDFALNMSSNNTHDESGSGWLSVLNGLTHKHIELFEILCKHVLPLENKRMLRSEMLEALKKKMAANSLEDLRRLLKEFLDHNIIQEQKDYLVVHLSDKELAYFLQKKEEKHFQ